MNHLDLFSGYGGFALAAREVWGEEYKTAGFCEIDPFCQNVLRKNFPNVPVYGDIRKLTATTLLADAEYDGLLGAAVGRAGMEQQQGREEESYSPVESQRGHKRFDLYAGIDFITGGFPCQSFSHAGRRRGTSDERWLWPEMFRIIRETAPLYVLAENVPGLLSIEGGMVFEQVCLDLESEGYEVQPLVIPAAGVGAPHKRERVWIVGRRKTDVEDSMQFRSRGRREDGRQILGSGAAEVQAPQSDSKVREGVAADPQCLDSAGRRGAGDLAGETENTEGAKEERERMRDTAHDGGQDAAHAPGQRLPQSRQAGVGELSAQGGERIHHRPQFDRSEWNRDWREVALATCHVPLDDGTPKRLVVLPDGTRISEARWRREALKACGNGIVPAVAVEIMKAIRVTEKSPSRMIFSPDTQT